MGCAEKSKALVVIMIWFLWYKLVWFMLNLLLFVVVVIVVAMVKFVGFLRCGRELGGCGVVVLLSWI